MPVTSPNSVPLGTVVNVVQKQDQPTGRLTPGVVAQILTKGPHPRGVKVRLQDGRVGRVHALGSGGSAGSDVGGNGAATGLEAGRSGSAVTAEDVAPRGMEVRSHGGNAGRRFQRDVRLEDEPSEAPEERSLEDYVTLKVAKPRGKRKGQGKSGGGAAGGQVEAPLAVGAGRQGEIEVEERQQMLQKEFPRLDSALIAAILGDVENMNAAREVLGKVS